jgi:thiol-disulfide isomerase/thioredoxin
MTTPTPHHQEATGAVPESTAPPPAEDAAAPAPASGAAARPAEDATPPALAGHRRLVTALAAVASALVLGGVGTLAFLDDGAKPAGASTAAAGFVLPELDGEGTVRLEDLRGRPTVVNLFASWCDVCDLELPAYMKLSRELEGKVHFVGVASMETGDPSHMISRHGLDAWKLARDIGPGGKGFHDELAPGFGMPVTAFYDANGRLVKVHRGGLLEDDLRVTLKQAYGEL